MPKTQEMHEGLKTIHDLVLAAGPEDLAHDKEECEICQMPPVSEQTRRGEMDPKSYTEEELKAEIAKAIAEATGPLQTQIAELTKVQQQTEEGKALAEVTAAKDAEIADLQSKLDASALEASTVKAELEAVNSFWTNAIQEAETAAATEARKAERLEKLKEVAPAAEEYLVENADRFAAMSDEDFEVRLEEFRLLASKATTTSESTSTTESTLSTALKASREVTSGSKSALEGLSALRQARVNPRAFRA